MPRRAGMFLLLFFGLGGVVSETGAVPTLDLSWHHCSPVVTAVSGPLPGTYRVYASVTGQLEPLQAYQVQLYLRRPDFLPISDAWRFDAGGCQGSSRLEIRHLPPPALATSCPALGGADESLQFKDYVLDERTGGARLVLAVRSLDAMRAPDPGVRSFLLGVNFDHAYSVVGPGSAGTTCGGFENDLVISFTLNLGCHSPQDDCPDPTRPSWLDAQGQEHEFAMANESVTFCGSCAPVPARNATWGAIKGQYRH